MAQAFETTQDALNFQQRDSDSNKAEVVPPEKVRVFACFQPAMPRSHANVCVPACVQAVDKGGRCAGGCAFNKDQPERVVMVEGVEILKRYPDRQPMDHEDPEDFEPELVERPALKQVYCYSCTACGNLVFADDKSAECE